MAKTQSRLKQSARDMVFSLGVIAVPIALVVVLYPSGSSATPIPAISTTDFQSTLTAARANEPFEVLAPTGLPSTWEATSENYTEPGASAADWHVGYLISGASSFAELEQTTEPIGGFLNDQKSDATDVANVQINGATWQEYTGTTPSALKILLVRTATGSVTDLVAGNAALAQLELLAGALR